eukprot:GHRQ01021296.1.p4 GENE.GHRQ01021296.1~~GHRQ01021296.1.p4  ORF type:complete len:167 (-),score=71.67 GHRQ01021296.1:926-1426(-)
MFSNVQTLWHARVLAPGGCGSCMLSVPPAPACDHRHKHVQCVGCEGGRQDDVNQLSIHSSLVNVDAPQHFTDGLRLGQGIKQRSGNRWCPQQQVDQQQQRQGKHNAPVVYDTLVVPVSNTGIDRQAAAAAAAAAAAEEVLSWIIAMLLSRLHLRGTPRCCKMPKAA